MAGDPEVSRVIDIRVDDESWRSIAVDHLVGECCAAARAAAPALNGSVSFLFTDDAAMKTLNASFRDVDKPTNVLSFPSGDAAQAFLGDVALGFETCARQAADGGVALADHAAHLIVNGLLHLVGYDHQTDDDAGVMEKLEVRILAQLGVNNPYEGCDE